MTKGFDIQRLPRTSLQKGGPNSTKFKVVYPLFKKCIDKDKYENLSPEDLGTVHPWLRNAPRVKNKEFMLNFPYPSYFDYNERSTELRKLKDIDPPFFFFGDIIVMTFRMGFHIDDREWGSDIMPDEFIRVQKAHNVPKPLERDAKPYPAANKRRRLDVGKVSVAVDGELLYI